MKHFSLICALATTVSAGGYVKVCLDKGNVPHGPAPQIKPRSSDGGKGFLKMDFETERVGESAHRLRARQLDEEDLDQNITLASERSVC